MKTINTKISLLILMAFGLVLNANAFKANDTISLLEVKGKIMKREKTYGVYKVQLIYNNAVQETKVINDEKPFVFNIPNNKQYIIKVIKEGYVDKTVCISKGQVKNETSYGPYRYEFVVNLESIGVQSNSDMFSSTTSVETKTSKNLPEFNWKRKYCRKVTALP